MINVNLSNFSTRSLWLSLLDLRQEVIYLLEEQGEIIAEFQAFVEFHFWKLDRQRLPSLPTSANSLILRSPLYLTGHLFRNRRRDSFEQCVIGLPGLRSLGRCIGITPELLSFGLRSLLDVKKHSWIEIELRTWPGSFILRVQKRSYSECNSGVIYQCII